MADKPRGLCPMCHREIQLKADGALRHHGGPPSSATWGRRTYRCDGAGMKPSPTARPDNTRGA